MSRFLLIGIAVIALAGCTATAPAPTPSAPGPDALAEWHDAYDFLDDQSRPVEVVCYTTEEGDDGWEISYDKPPAFYSLDADTDQWQPYLTYRDDPDYNAGGTACAINIPTSLPYEQTAIEGFLNPLGYTFFDNAAPDLHRVEISYAGSTPNDPDVQFAEEPGLFGLLISLQLLRDDAIDPETHAVIAPETEEQASTYLTYASPLLKWYGYEG